MPHSVTSLLDRAVRAQRRRLAAWAVATVLTAAAAAALLSSEAGVVAAVLGAGAVLYSARQLAGIGIAQRDFHGADTDPRRAWVALVHDPNPRAWRPLLGVWDETPAAGERLPKPRSVWRCDSDLDALQSFAADVVVHEAWLDTGPRSWSKPRWVRADAGIALPHRRSLLGRWYLSLVLKHARPDEPRPLTLRNPRGDLGAAEHLPLQGSPVVALAWRVGVLGGITALAALLS